LAFGVDAYASRGRVGGRQELLIAPPEVQGRRINRGASYAFLISSDRNGAPQAATMLQREDVRVHFTTREIETADRQFAPGSLVVFTAGNPDRLPEILDRTASICGVDIIGVDSGLTATGPDLGSSRVRSLKPVRVAIVADDPVDPTSVGSCWYLIDRLYGIPHSLIGLNQLTEDHLSDYEVLVFPDDGASGRGYAAAVDSTRIEAIAAWVKDGGVFVGLGGGGFFGTDDLSGLSSIAVASKNGSEDLSDEEQEARDRERRLEFRRDRDRRRRTEAIPGTIFRVRVDPLHPLGFGYQETAEVLKLGPETFELGPEGTNVALFSSRPKVAGYAPDEAVRHLIDRPFLVAEPSGDGHVVLYAEDPNFRLFWYGLTRLFLNGLLFLPSID
jgi:hypothetical protein